MFLELPLAPPALLLSVPAVHARRCRGGSERQGRARRRLCRQRSAVAGPGAAAAAATARARCIRSACQRAAAGKQQGRHDAGGAGHLQPSAVLVYRRRWNATCTCSGQNLADLAVLKQQQAHAALGDMQGAAEHQLHQHGVSTILNYMLKFSILAGNGVILQSQVIRGCTTPCAAAAASICHVCGVCCRGVV